MIMRAILVISVFLAVALVTFLVLNYFFPKLLVEGRSMYPTLKEGEKLMSARLTKHERQNLVCGLIYVFHIFNDDNGEPYYMIKRLNHTVTDEVTGETMCYFLGDNADESNDSRNFGYVPESAVIAVVLYKLGGNV